ncbi:MAG: hypothetical protein L0Y54_22840 [Sporichthyaceae bacterium]|nr:hypothetical protein [Sporichthyaceae bacterium]
MRNAQPDPAPVGLSAVQRLLRAGEPHGGPAAPGASRGPEPPAPGARQFVVSAAHGGAGASTVTAMLDPDGAGAAVEAPPGMPAPGRCPVLVARASSYGLLRAGQVLTSWPVAGPRPYLVLVADAPVAMPGPARFRLRVLGGSTAGVAHVRYLFRLRWFDHPTAALEIPAVAAAAQRLRARLSG